MEMKPSDFYIGVLDVFAVILPGAVLTFFLKGLFYEGLFDGRIFPQLHTEIQKAVAFLIVTYIVGNLIFPLGSFILDKWVYDKFLRNTLFQRNFDLAYYTATSIRDEYLSPDAEIHQHIIEGKLSAEDINKILAKSRHKREVINTYKWSQKCLAVVSPTTLTEIQKLEADSKFFRSIAVAFVIIGGILLSESIWIWGACFLILALLSVYRYGDLRYKSTESAYEQIIAIDHLEKLGPGAPVQDNRSGFIVPVETLNAHRERIAALTNGRQCITQALVIPRGEMWNVANSSTEIVYCLEGQGLLRISGALDAVSLSPEVIVPLPARTNIEIHNSTAGPLVMLCVK